MFHIVDILHGSLQLDAVDVRRYSIPVDGEGQTCGAALLAKMVTQKCKAIWRKTHKHGNRSTLSRFDQRNADRKWVDRPVSSTLVIISLH